MCQSGEGCKRITKVLDLPWSTVKTVIIKWGNYTAVTLLRIPFRIDEKPRNNGQEGFQEAYSNINRAASINGKYLVCTTGDCSHVFITCLVWDMVERWNPISWRKDWISQNFSALKTLLNACGQMFYDLGKPKWIILVIIPNGIFGAKTTLNITERSPWDHHN